MEKTRMCGAVSPHGTKCTLLVHLGVHYDRETECLWQDNSHIHDSNLAGDADQCSHVYPNNWQCHQPATHEAWCLAHTPEDDDE